MKDFLVFEQLVNLFIDLLPQTAAFYSHQKLKNLCFVIRQKMVIIKRLLDSFLEVFELLRQVTMQKSHQFNDRP